jgi:hypothetical protein
MDSICRYILESWKKIIAYATSTVTSPMKLFCQYFTEGWCKITPNTANIPLQSKCSYLANIGRQENLVFYRWKMEWESSLSILITKNPN